MVSPVFFFIPNLIGYTRIVLAIVAFYVSFTDYKIFFVCYALSEILDAVDGHAARAFGQSSKFGAVLDMVTDRCATTCLLVVLAYFYPAQIYFFLPVIALDITSHYAHLYSTLVRGVTSHKQISDKQNRLLQLYYHNRAVLGALCFGNEAFFVGLYICHFQVGPVVAFGLGLVQLCVYAVAPLMAIKQLMNLIQLGQAAADIVEIDDREIAAKAGKKK